MSGASKSGELGEPRGPRGSRLWARDLAGALALVEGAIAQRVLVAIEGFEVPSHNAFGEEVVVERGADVTDLVRRCGRAAEEGQRVALVARASDLPAARAELASIAARRLGLVVHAIAEPARDSASPSVTGLAPALALDDLFWGMLLGAGVSDAIDLALIARRAAEDSGCPFFVVHEGSHAHDIEPIASPSPELCDAFIGQAQGRVRRATASLESDGPALGDRAFAERVPFALGSAMRELEALTGRHHDVIERAPALEGAVGLVGAGALGDSLIADVERLRAGGDDVVAVRVVAWRPFPAPRLVRALGRALAVTVLERVDQPLASSAPLATQLKAAFSDALTWAPDYPGIGRIPRIVSGVVAPARAVDSSDLDAIVHNVLADERGKRSFILGGEEAHALEHVRAHGQDAGSASAPPPRVAPGTFVMRGLSSRREVAVASAELCAAVLASALGLRTRATVRGLGAEEGGGVAFDLVAARTRPRGVHAPHAVGVVALDEPALLARGHALSRLAPGGLVAMPSTRRAAEAIWAEVPHWAKAVVFDRGARLVGWAPGADRDDPDKAAAAWVAASAFVGLALAVASSDRTLGADHPIDGQVVEREVGEALRVGVASHARDAGALADAGAHAARSAFESIVEIPRAMIEREDDGVRLGRKSARPSPG